MKILVWLIFAALAVLGGLYVPQIVAKEIVFRSGISSWGWELLPALLIGPPTALAVYCLLFRWMSEQPFAWRCIANALVGVIASSGIVVIVLSFRT